MRDSPCHVRAIRSTGISTSQIPNPTAFWQSGQSRRSGQSRSPFRLHVSPRRQWTYDDLRETRPPVKMVSCQQPQAQMAKDGDEYHVCSQRPTPLFPLSVLSSACFGVSACRRFGVFALDFPPGHRTIPVRARREQTPAAGGTGRDARKKKVSERTHTKVGLQAVSSVPAAIALIRSPMRPR